MHIKVLQQEYFPTVIDVTIYSYSSYLILKFFTCWCEKIHKDTQKKHRCKEVSSSYPPLPPCIRAVINHVLRTRKLAHWMKLCNNQSVIFLPALRRSIRVLHNADSNTPVTQGKNDLDRYLEHNLDSDLDCDPEDVPVYTGHSSFNTSHYTLLYIV